MRIEAMSEQKHTMGPYKATHIGEDEFRKEIIIDVATCGQIAEVLDTGNGRATATLLAAAPELLECLEWAMNIIDSSLRSVVHAGHSDYDRATNAIAKAK